MTNKKIYLKIFRIYDMISLPKKNDMITVHKERDKYIHIYNISTF